MGLFERAGVAAGRLISRLGPSFRPASHATPVHCFVLGIDEDLTIRPPAAGRRWRMRSALIPARTMHRVEVDGRVLLHYLHVESARRPGRAARLDTPGMPVEDWLAADIDFHTAIAATAKNRILQLAMTAVHTVRPRTNAPLRPSLDKDEVWRQHGAIYAAIRDGDPDAAERALTAHVDYLDGLNVSDSAARS